MTKMQGDLLQTEPKRNKNLSLATIKQTVFASGSITLRSNYWKTCQAYFGILPNGYSWIRNKNYKLRQEKKEIVDGK